MRSKRNIYSIALLILFSISFALTITSCSKEEKEAPKSMEQIRREDGVPVKIEPVEYKEFETELSFFSKLSGIKETTKYSPIADKIVKIRANVGDNVKEKQVVLEFPTDNPAIQFQQAKVGYEIAEKNYNRLKALLEAGEVSQANYDGAEAQYLVSKRNYEALKQMLSVESPISGTIIEMLVEEGDDIGKNKPVFTVAQLNVMKAFVWASESEVIQITKGMTGVIKFNGQEFKGKVTEISLAMDNKMKAFKVELQFKNPKRLLKSGTTADLKIRTYHNPESIVVPRNLIKNEAGKNFVYLEKDGYSEKRFIETGLESGLNIEVISGLKIGSKLIVKGASLLENRTKVKVLN